MIRITFYANKDEKLVGFDVAGHAGYDEIGKDIVCAAISALSQSAELYIKKNAKQYESPEVKGITIVHNDLNKTEEINAVIESFRLGALQIAEQYQEYVKVVTLHGCNFNFDTNSSKITMQALHG